MKTNMKLIIFAAVFFVWMTGCEQPSLSKLEIIDIANKTAVSQGLNLDEYKLYYDEGNAQSGSKIVNVKGSSSGFSKMLKTVKSKDSQAVIYKHKDTRGSKGSHTFYINRKTGKVIAYFKGK
jgi:hypothetical protein